MASLFLKSFHRYGKLTFEIDLMKNYGLLPASLSHQSRTSIAALHSLLHVPCSAAEPQRGSQATPNQIHEAKTHKKREICT